MSTQATPYFSPSERFYRGEISREEARNLVRENARRARKDTGSPTLNVVLRVAGLLILPLVFLIDLAASRRG